MRTTLTLDADVAAEVERLRKQRQLSLEEVVNDLLRAGLEQRRAARRSAPRRFETRAVDLGPCLVGDLDDVAGALASAESERFR